MKDLKNVNLTIFKKDLSQQDFKDKLYNNYSISKCIIGHLEKTKQEKEHYHCYVSFTRKVGFDNFKNIFPFIHIEQVYGSLKQNYDYCTKEGVPFYCSFDISELDSKEDIERALINDILIEKYPLKFILLKYPKFAIYNFKNIKELVDIRDNL